MKTSHFLALLKYPGYDMPLFSIPILSFICGLEFAGAYHFSLSLNGFGVLLLSLFPLPAISIGHIFRQGTEEDKSFENLEFLFSKAINRTTLFCVKASLYLVISLLPMVTGWAYSFTQAGRADFFVFTCVSIFTFILLFQVVIFAFPRVPRWVLLSPMVIIAVLGVEISMLNANNNSMYENGVALVIHHALLTFLGLVLLTALAQRYCCRRFVNTEFTS